MNNFEGIQINNLVKEFGSNRAIDDVSLHFEKEKIYGLLGRNGAGKSTLFNLIANRLFPTSGSITIDGQIAVENDMAQGNVYMMSEQNLYPDTYKVKQVFQCTKSFYPGFDDEYAKELCDEFELNPNKLLRTLSTGYTSIYKLITALCVKADYILLDEPVLGLDANHRDLFYRCLIKSYSDNPRTFIISTHLIDEVVNVIEEVMIIKKGKIIRNQSCEELLASGYTVSGPISIVDDFIKGKEVLGTTILGGLKTVNIHGQYNKMEIPVGVEITKLDLQKLFIDLTNN